MLCCRLSEADHDCFDEDDGLHVVLQARAGLLEMSVAGRWHRWVGGGVWEGRANISTRRRHYCSEASWSSRCSSGSCRVTLPLQEEKMNEREILVEHLRDDETKTYILVSELGNYDLQTDVFLLINLCYCAPIVLLKSTKSHFRRNLPWILKIQTIVNKQQLKEAENVEMFKYLSNKGVSKGEWRVSVTLKLNVL